jgi:hypothetical protein
MRPKAKDRDSSEEIDLPPEFHLPGLSELREVVAKYSPQWVPSFKRFVKTA